MSFLCLILISNVSRSTECIEMAMLSFLFVLHMSTVGLADTLVCSFKASSVAINVSFSLLYIM